MGTAIDRPGNFQCEFKEYGLTERESGAVAISVIAQITAQYNDESGEWDDWKEYDVEARGDLYIIKKDGGLNNSQVEALCKYAGWSGSLAAIRDRTWTPTPCQVSIEGDEYKGVTRYKIGFVNAFDRTPGGVGNITDDKVKALEVKFGASLRAVAGSATHGTTKPAGKPAAPPRRNADKQPFPDPNATGDAEPMGDANAALLEEAYKAKRGAGAVDEPEFVE